MTSSNGRPLPDGTVTFVFMDIEGSTRLLQEIGQDYPALLATYRHLTEASIGPGDGVIFGSEGDGLFLAFPEAGAAVRAAVQAQLVFAGAEWPGHAEVRVRMGIHTGAPTVIGDDYTGIDVHRTARIMAAAWGGQVLLSEATHSLVTDSGIVCRDLGRFDMKGLARPERLYQLECPGLVSDFPPVRARRRNVEVPVFLTSFVGRDDDLAVISRLLDEGARLVTLTGPGGIGKSRLAAVAAARLDAFYSDGARYIDLSNETEPERVPAAIAEGIGVPRDVNHPPLEVLIDHLQPLDTLLVLDGFERVIDSAVAIANLVGRCPSLRLLVTSRVALRIGAEREIRVDPLGWADEDASFAEVTAAPAARLFVDRVRLARPEFELTPANAGVIRDLVERMDGNPLSIELAAARARLLPPEAILERLGAVLELGSTSPELPTRQRSLRATIEWSHGLLTEPDQRLYRRLGVFADGWGLEAAEAVAGDDAPDVFLGLETLVAQSMITVEPDGRMNMGTAMREFACEQLAAVGDEEETRQRHAEFYERLAVDSEPLLRGPRQREMVVMLSHEWRNLRSAAEWALRTDRFQLAGSIYVRTWIVAWQGDNWRDAKSYTGELMQISDQLDESLRAKAGFVAAGTFMEMGDPETALTYARPAVDLAARIGDKDTEAWARLMIAGSIMAIDLLSAEGREQVNRAVALARSIDDPFLLGYAMSFQAAMLTLDGDPEAGFRNHTEVLAIARDLENVPLISQSLSQAAFAHMRAGEPGLARQSLEAAAENLDRLRHLEGLALLLDATSLLAFFEQDMVRAVTALGAADATRAKVGLVRWALVAALLESAGVAAEAENPDLAEARLAGSEMAPHDAIAFALEPHHELATAT